MSATAAELVRGPSGLAVVAFPASWLALEVEDRDGNPRTAEGLETAREVWRRESEAVVLVDGPMFTLVGGGSDYRRATAANLLYRYFDAARRVDVPSSYPDRGATLSVDGEGRATWLQGAREARGAVFAVQGYPELLRSGDNVASVRNDRDTTGRAALCLLSDGRAAFAIGRAPMREFAEVLRGVRVGAASVTDAAYLDGGGSTSLALRGANGSDLFAHGLDARRLPVYLLAVPPRGGRGATGVVWWGSLGSVAVAVGVVAAGVAALRRWRQNLLTHRGQ